MSNWSEKKAEAQDEVNNWLLGNGAIAVTVVTGFIILMIVIDLIAGIF